MDIKLLNDGTILNTTIIKPEEVIVLDTTKYQELKEFNDSIRKYAYGSSGVFITGSELPLIMFGESIEVNGYLRIINSIDDFISAVNDSDKPLTFNSIKFNKATMKYQRRFLSSTQIHNLGYELMSEYIESFIMLYEHCDHELVLNDTLGITSGTILVNRSAEQHSDFSDYVKYQVSEIPNDLLEIGNKLYCSILKDIMYNIRNLCNHSVAIEINANRVMVTMFASPIERRYLLAVDKTS